MLRGDFSVSIKEILTPSFMSDTYCFSNCTNFFEFHREILKNARGTRECASGVRE